MSKRWVLLLFACLIIMTLGFRSGRAQSPDPLSVGEAIQIAARFVTGESRLIPSWTGAVLDAPVAHYDLTGKVAAFVIPIMNQGQDAGYVTISAERLENPVLEFSTQPAAIHLFGESDPWDQEIAIDPSKPLYLGMLAYFYPVVSANELLLVEMGSRQVITIPDLPSTILDWNPVPEGVPELQAGSPTALALSAVPIRKLLRGPDYLWYRGSAPTAVANIMGYWADRGYPALMSGGSKGDSTGTIDQLAQLMHTSSTGWTKQPINDDILGFAETRGYANIQSREIEFAKYNQLTAEIDAYRPLVILVIGHILYGDRFITMFGYEEDPAVPNHRYMIVHDSRGIGDYWVQYGTGYKKIWYDTMVPPQITVDTTPPSSTVTILDAMQVSENFLVSWSGSDTGWGIAGYDIQIRDGQSGSWTGWLTDTLTTSATYQGQRGHHYYFRSSAYDVDGNRETYADGDGDTHTQIPIYVVNGSVSNNRGQPLRSARVKIQPGATVQTGADGKYHIGLESGGTYTLTIQGSTSYGALPTIRVPVTADIDLPRVVLPPSQNLIHNGTFENDLSGWLLSGEVPAVISDQALTGQKALVLGQNPAGAGGQSVISQYLSIPGALSQPTLSLSYRTQGLWNPYPLTITIYGTKITTYNLTLNRTGWQHAWFDLADFKGQDVEISIYIQASTPGSPITIWLDDISLGPASPGISKLYTPMLRK